MGEVEIDQCQWHAETRTLSGRSLRPAGETGNLFLHVPADLQVSRPRGLWIAKDARDRSLVIRVALDFADGAANWSVSFAPLSEEGDV